LLGKRMSALCDRSRLLDVPAVEASLILVDVGGEEPEPRGIRRMRLYCLLAEFVHEWRYGANNWCATPVANSTM
jgi:hypothetical protein